MVDGGRNSGNLCLSVIIPTINEADQLPVLLDQLQQQENITLDIIVVDGGSSDNTCAVATAKGAQLINSAKGRAMQLNAGAKQANYACLLFLHADSQLEHPECLAEALHYFQTRERNESQVAGHFPLQFIRQNKEHQLGFRYLEAKTHTNRPYTINGDQGLLIGQAFFNVLGGYDESLPFLEDQAIAAKIFSEGRWLLLPGYLCTSARRFEREGFHRRYILMGLITGLYWTGAHTFFTRAKAVYAEQSQTAKLPLWPYFRCIWAIQVRDLGLTQSIVQWYKVGRFVRRNAWQLFLFLDVAFGRQRKSGGYRCVRFYDRFVYPLTNNKVCNLLVVPLVFIWYMLILAPVYYLLERWGAIRSPSLDND